MKTHTLTPGHRVRREAKAGGIPLFLVLPVGLVLFIITLAVAWAYIGLNWVAGILWFMLKTYVLVFTFVWMRGTLPRVRIDQLMGFAWKWLVEISLLNAFVTAGAILILDSLANR